jgi:hypothetical protein
MRKRVIDRRRAAAVQQQQRAERTADRRVAAAAVAVALAVGVVGPIVTYRAALSGQRAASADERRRLDLADLRELLDTALGDLDALQRAEQAEASAWFRGAPVGVDAVTPQHRAVNDAYRRTGDDANRIAIRLGQHNTIWTEYNQASSGYYGASQVTQLQPYSKVTLQQYTRRYNPANEASARFLKAALAAARLRL